MCLIMCWQLAVVDLCYLKPFVVFQIVCSVCVLDGDSGVCV